MCYKNNNNLKYETAIGFDKFESIVYIGIIDSSLIYICIFIYL